MEDRLIRQLALDYCCTPAQVRDGKNHFTEYSPLPGRRMFQESGEGCFLKMAAAGGKLLRSAAGADLNAVLLRELTVLLGEENVAAV